MDENISALKNLFGARLPDADYHLREFLSIHPSLAVARDHAGNTGLWLACHANDVSCANLLLENGADLAATTYAGRSCLHACASTDASDTAAWFIGRWLEASKAHSAKDACLSSVLEARTLTGYTALWWCCMDGASRVARLLLSKGADHRAVDTSARVSCIGIAQQRVKKPLIRLMQEAERIYMIAQIRELRDFGRAAIALSEKSLILDSEEETERQICLISTADFVTAEMGQDLFLELVGIMRGSAYPS